MFKVFIGKGNNSLLVKNIIKQKTQWNIIETDSNLEAIHFMWTSHLHEGFITNQTTTEGKSAKR
jgi:phosphodiesterase/alkaline phosphatase D-like protein